MFLAKELWIRVDAITFNMNNIVGFKLLHTTPTAPVRVMLITYDGSLVEIFVGKVDEAKWLQDKLVEILSDPQREKFYAFDLKK